MKKMIVLSIALITLFSWSIALAGEVNGRTFVSSKYSGFTITVPEKWKVMDMEDEESDGNTHPVLELKRKESLRDNKPNGDLTAFVLEDGDIHVYAEAFVPGLKDAGFKIKKNVKKLINGKEGYDIKGVMTVGTIKVETRWYIMSNDKYIFLLSLYEANALVFNKELSELIGSIKYK